MYRWELEDLAEEQIAGLPAFARRALTELLDAAVIVDPAEYQRAPGERSRPLRTYGSIDIMIEKEAHYPAAAISRDASSTSAAFKSGNASRMASVS